MGPLFLLQCLLKEVKCMIRYAMRDDIPAMTKIYNDAIKYSNATYDINPQSEAQRGVWFDAHQENNPILVFEVDDKIVGYTGLSPFGSDDGYLYSVNLCIYVDWSNRGEGYGSDLMFAILDIARARQDVHTVVSEITSSNVASIALHERFGFEFRGLVREVGYKFGEFHDMCYYQLMVNGKILSQT